MVRSDQDGRNDDVQFRLFRLTESVLLGNVAFRVGEQISWNTEKGTTGNKEADALLGREYRKGWEVPKV